MGINEIQWSVDQNRQRHSQFPNHFQICRLRIIEHVQCIIGKMNGTEPLEIVQNRKNNSQHPVYDFTIVNEKNEIVCKACNHRFPNHHAGNIQKHMKSKHKTDFDGLVNKIDAYYGDATFVEANGDATVNESNSVATEINKNQRGRRGKNKGNLITVVHDVTDIKLGLVEMCSVNMCSFRQLRNSGL